MLDTGLAVGAPHGSHALPKVPELIKFQPVLLVLFICLINLQISLSNTALDLQDDLLRYLQSAIAGFPQVDSLDIQQFKHGQSNPTYLLQVGPPALYKPA